MNKRKISLILGSTILMSGTVCAVALPLSSCGSSIGEKYLSEHKSVHSDVSELTSPKKDWDNLINHEKNINAQNIVNGIVRMLTDFEWISKEMTNLVKDKNSPMFLPFKSIELKPNVSSTTDGDAVILNLKGTKFSFKAAINVTLGEIMKIMFKDGAIPDEYKTLFDAFEEVTISPNNTCSIEVKDLQMKFSIDKTIPDKFVYGVSLVDNPSFEAKTSEQKMGSALDVAIMMIPSLLQEQFGTDKPSAKIIPDQPIEAAPGDYGYHEDDVTTYNRSSIEMSFSLNGYFDSIVNNLNLSKYLYLKKDFYVLFCDGKDVDGKSDNRPIVLDKEDYPNAQFTYWPVSNK